MDAMLDMLADPALPYAGPTMGLLVFAATAILAFGLMGLIRSRAAVRRRASGVGARSSGDERRTLRYSSLQAAQRLAEYTTRHFAAAPQEQAHALRSRLVQAGFLDARAVASYFLARVAAAVGFGLIAAVVAPIALSRWPSAFWPAVWAFACLGYFVPKLCLDRCIARRREQHRAGFPDFMDLLVVCSNAGLSMEAALDRVGRELSDSYPSLSANIYMTCLELRAGRTMGEALEHLAERLGLEEARAFATLLQQSEELGSSLTDTLRVYSEDMRHKRMSLAEEKAYSLPAKLSVPLILCIFPVIIIVIILPVFVRIKFGLY